MNETKVILRPNKLASKRTKEKIKQFGPIFFLVIKNRRPQSMDHKLCHCFRSLETNKWFGWLPDLEINMERVE